ncbi:LysE family translocator [Gilvimarinus sp. SDUM040013]|uniref:LysE family translocator n=1 Tax=Gilvimarinus gilvus TaxID=3058038 RepID=A0ABU4S072_9GAMM|nr:LysE family translocator [Gilvimarinus sp. SDUM040013]MDO3384752.1 LysE family translocator [Gilvimarinus sp. SDUM040013]MDX6850430.1 LysE family translocator [Gilvimarinus sp. SDUM040013]
MNDALLTQLGIITVMVGTPGPNNLLLMTTGVHFGVRQSLPLIAGIVLGCAAMLLSTSYGVNHLFSAYPLSKTLFSAASAGFLAYLTLGLLRQSASNTTGPMGRPWSVWQGAAFQWLNPKAWLMCMTLASTGEANALYSMLTLAAIFSLVATPLLLAWSWGGYYLAHWLSLPGRLSWFNRAMAACLLGCAISLLWT